MKGNEEINIIILSNITFEPSFIPLLKLQFNEIQMNARIFPIAYEERNDKKYKEQLSKAGLIVVWLNFELLFPDLLNAVYSLATTEQQIIDEITILYKKLCSELKSYLNAQILWFSFDDYCDSLHIVTGHNYNALIDKLNLKLCETLRQNISFINLKRLIAEIGIANAYNQKSKYRWNAPYSDALVEFAVKEIHKQYLIEKGVTKKCLVLDCDNVLWGNILSEDGIENLKLSGSGFGQPYQDFQRFVLSLYYHGVILAVCSKNDLSDVMTMFREHSEMLLKEEHIACFQVNWKNKPDNIKRIAEKLNISLDSMVFIDDSPIEIEAVKSILPEVTVILYDRESVYDKLSCFNLKSNVSIANIKKRNETYRTNQSREALKSKYQTYSEYISALEIKIDIHEALPMEFSRISELTQRTNKCTNGKRYIVSEIKERTKINNVKLYSFSASDRFSDLGLVGAIEIEGDALTLFNLSCRALGRELEETMLDFIKDKHNISKIEFFPTGKNEDVKNMLMKSFPNVKIL